MRLVVMLPPTPDRRWELAAQMGISGIIAKLAPELTGALPPWDYASFAAAAARYRAGGFEIVGLEGDQFDMSRIKFGLPGGDEDIARYCDMLTNMGRLGIRLLCYNFMAGLGWYRTATAAPGRGGALVTVFDAAAAAAQGLTEHGPVPAQRIWENYAYFLTRVLPAAEAAGVRMGLHPDDPPVAELRGIGRIFTSAAAVERALALSPSPSHALTFCQATYKVMGEDVAAVARRFAARIAFVHIRDVRGEPGHFTETFPEDGATDMAAMFRTYRDIGFTGPIRPDHAPAMSGDATHDGPVSGTNVGYEATGLVYTVGYMKGLMQATSGLAPA